LKPGIFGVQANEAVHSDHIREAGGAGAHGAEQAHGLVEVGNAIGDFENAAGDGTQHVDLGVEVVAVDLVEVGGLGLAQAAGVKAMAEGVGVAELGAAFARSHDLTPYPFPKGKGRFMQEWKFRRTNIPLMILRNHKVTNIFLLIDSQIETY
jgi:hypothetical protein